MAGYIEPEEILFMAELFDSGPWCETDFVTVWFWGLRHLQLTEQRDLTAAPVSVRGCACGQSLIDSLEKFRSLSSGKIECTGTNQVLQDLAVDRLGTQTTAVILHRFERTAL